MHSVKLINNPGSVKVQLDQIHLAEFTCMVWPKTGGDRKKHV